MSEPLTYECSVQFRRRGRGARKELAPGDGVVRPAPEPGRVPRVARLMALAIRFDGYLRDRHVADYAELAELGHVSRARISQIMNLLNLAPDIQEAVLFLPRIERGGDVIHLRRLQQVAATPDWRKQRTIWRALTAPASFGRKSALRRL